MTLGLLVILAGTSPAESCRDAYDRLDYEAASRECARAVTVAPPQQLAGLYRFLGLSYATLGDEPRAYAAFVSYLTMDPAAELSPTVSPRLRAQFLIAKEKGAGAEIHLHVEALSTVRVAQPVRLSVSAEDGRTAPVRSVRAGIDAERAIGTRRDAPIEIDVSPPSHPGPMTLFLSGLDAFGGALITTPWTVDVAPRKDPRGWPLSWKVWGGASVLLAGAATGAAIYSRSQADSANLQTTAVGTHDRAQRSAGGAWAADVGWGAGVALAIGAIYLFLTDPAREP